MDYKLSIILFSFLVFTFGVVGSYGNLIRFKNENNKHRKTSSLQNKATYDQESHDVQIDDSIKGEMPLLLHRIIQARNEYRQEYSVKNVKGEHSVHKRDMTEFDTFEKKIHNRSPPDEIEDILIRNHQMK